ncbi:hypothetical protein MPL3365_70043 [Mesorhizobium plurifarium]|uniref:Uncharacterized protein n=1 Tax=Mesorhizobium plurifarium TaxID=69974 RepID=A0A090GVX5_MESPL|nr:hypothetical protein MPL3365_70043 [Mesorhizobium plurifarium]
MTRNRLSRLSDRTSRRYQAGDRSGQRGKAQDLKMKKARRNRRASYGTEVEVRRRHDPGVWIASKFSQQRPAGRLTNL